MSDNTVKGIAIIGISLITIGFLFFCSTLIESKIIVSGSISDQNIIVDLPEEWESITKDTLIATRRGKTLILEFKH